MSLAVALRRLNLTIKENVYVYIFGRSNVGKSAIRSALQKLVCAAFEVLFDNDEKYENYISFIDDTNSLSSNHLRNGTVILLYIYDICDESSTENIHKVYRTHLASHPSIATATARVVVGNKIDLEYWRRVSVQQGAAVATSVNAIHCEVSAFTGLHMDILCDIILREVLVSLQDTSTSSAVVDILTNAQKGKLQTQLALACISDDLFLGDEEEESREVEERSWGADDDVDLYGGMGISATAGRAAPAELDDLFSTLSSSVAPPPPAIPPPPPLPKAGPPPPRPSAVPRSAGPPPGAPRSISLSPPGAAPRGAPPMQAPIMDRIGAIRTFPSDEKEEKVKKDMVVEKRKKVAAKKEKQQAVGEALPSRMRRRSVSKEEAAPLPETVTLNILQEERKALGKKRPGAPAMPPLSRRDEESIDRISAISGDISEVQEIMLDNIDKILDRGEKLETLEIQAATLELQSAEFYQKSSKLKMTTKTAGIILCLPCILVSYCCESMYECVKSTCSTIADWISIIRNKQNIFDNVLADNENAFQTLAKFLVLIQDTVSCSCGLVMYALVGVWLEVLAWIISYVTVLASTLLLILPSFFTLLVVRTTSIETESKAFGVRQEVIRHEKKKESFVRWVRIILRSLPLSFYILALPYLIVYHIFPSALANENRTTIIGWIVGYLVGILLLQILGSVRAYYSWIRRDVKIPTPPPLYIEEEVKTGSKLCGCFIKEKEEHTEKVRKPAPVPTPPNTFLLSKPANLIEICSLSLEFFQMATFAFQHNPYEDDETNDDNVTPSPTMSPNDDSSSYDFWGKDIFQTLYVRISTGGADVQYALMWGTVGVVCALLALFAYLFLCELRVYGNLMRKEEDKDAAKDSFFYSFTGSVVYGHGRPRNISARMRMLVSILSDALFQVISFQLLQVFACDYSDNNDFATLRVEPSITCWEGHHAVVATCALTVYAFYVPLSIMITPMLLEAPESEKEKAGSGVTYLKLYLMTINVVKSVMLLVVVLGPQSVANVVICTIVSSFILSAITLLWLKFRDITTHYSADLHPCNIAFINYWKAASYTVAVVSAILIIIAHLLDDIFPVSALSYAMVATWIVIVVSFAYSYYRFYESNAARRELVKDLISYPFYFRDVVASKSEEPLVLIADKSVGSRMKNIPGYIESPWWDSTCNNLRQEENVTKHIIQYFQLSHSDK